MDICTVFNRGFLADYGPTKKPTKHLVKKRWVPRNLHYVSKRSQRTSYYPHEVFLEQQKLLAPGGVAR
jgi:hypothetical protein